jgi:hypothetical protein
MLVSMKVVLRADKWVAMKAGSMVDQWAGRLAGYLAAMKAVL